MGSPSTTSTLAKNTIDLWHIVPEHINISHHPYLLSQLSDEEKQNLTRFKHNDAKNTALISRSLCRLVLSQYTQTLPTQLNFKRNQHGKPHLIDNTHNLSFNLSHNKQAVVIAVCINDPIGCDIEDPNRKINIDTITKRYFAEREHQQLMLMPSSVKQQHFFKLWTLKEAFVKATGVGISLGLDSFYFDVKTLLKVEFNHHYKLNKQCQWQCLQQTLNHQILAVVRKSQLHQSINYCDASSLITNGK